MRQPLSFNKLFLIFWPAGYVVASAVCVIVWQIMEELRGSLHQTVLATGDFQKIAAFEAALQYDRHVSLVVLGLTFLVSACFPVAGFIYLRRKHYGPSSIGKLP